MNNKLGQRPQIFSFFRRHTISTLEIAIFFRQLSTLIAAGIPLVQSFDILRQTQENLQLCLLISTLKNEIEAGKNFISGLRKYPRYFDELNCHLVNAGEQTGTLEIMLKRIAHYKEKSFALKNQIKQALFYPCIIFFVALVICIIMLTMVIPRFADLFQSMHGSLPLFTQVVINFSIFLRANYWLGVIPIFAITIFMYYLKKSPSLKIYIDSIALKIPILYQIIQKIVMARFSRSLATTFSAGLPITESLKLVAYTCSNHVYTQLVIGLEAQVSSGKQLHVALSQNSLFPALVVHMIKVGEESGSLECMLEKIADLYEADIDHLVKNLSHLLEPLIMLVLGVLIGGLVIAMYLPIFKLGTVM